ncbi:MAG: type secretion system protein [Pseudomonadota bacterium]|jgi:general secretion pathway protein F
MPAFTYQAMNPQGKNLQGVLEGDSARAVRSMLRAQGLIPLQVDAVKANESQALGLNTVVFQARAFSAAALTVWTRQLASLTQAGLPLERALSALVDEAVTPRQRDVMASLRAEVNGGQSFAAALSQHPKEFSAIYCAVVGAGEQSGQLSGVLTRLADDLEAQQTLRSKVMAAMLYPAIVSGVALLIVLFLLASVVPQVAHVFTASQRSLPWLTQFMLSLSHVVQAGWLWGLSLLVLGSWVLKIALRQPLLRERWDAAWLRLPLVGRLARGYNAARFANTLATLVGAGVPILKALQAAAETLSNQALRADMLEALVLVREGAPLGSALGQKKSLPGLLPMFARLGEQTGQLPEMLQRAATQLSNDVQRRALQLATILEPLLIVVMGAMVMLIVLSVMLPIIQLNQLVR